MYQALKDEKLLTVREDIPLNSTLQHNSTSEIPTHVAVQLYESSYKACVSVTERHSLSISSVIENFSGHFVSRGCWLLSQGAPFMAGTASWRAPSWRGATPHSLQVEGVILRLLHTMRLHLVLGTPSQ